MTVTETQTVPSRGIQRWGAIAGIAFVVFLVLRFVAFLDTPDSDAPVREWTEYFDDSGNRTVSILGAYSQLLAGLGFLGFIWALRARLRVAERSADGFSALAFGAGLVFVGLVFVSAAAIANVAAGVEFGDIPAPDGEFARQFESLGFGLLLLFGMFAAGVCIAATSASALASGVLPRWLAITGLVVAVIVAVLGVVFFPLILLVLWVLAVSIVMLQRPATI
jgi:hypothetical protein